MRLSDDERYAAGLASLGAGPNRLRRFLDGLAPAEAWASLARGEHAADPEGAYREKALDDVVDAVAASCEENRVRVLLRGRPGYPAGLSEDHEAPAVLFALGDPTCSDGVPRVTVVGTRAATPYGLGVASDLGRALAEAGVVVISGLARGIDSAAHAGALADGSAPVIGVLGTGPDAPLPRSQAILRGQVAGRGSVLSEFPPGTVGAPSWWFVIRNRVMAALAHVVVVVECHLRGGALHTVKAANDRGVQVASVPGSVRSAASAGTNALLVDGAAPVRHIDDVLSALELAIAGRPEIAAPRSRVSSSSPSEVERAVRAPNPAAATVLLALEHDPVALDSVVRRSRMQLGDVALALEQLADSGLAVCESGWWSLPRR